MRGQRLLGAVVAVAVAAGALTTALVAAPAASAAGVGTSYVGASSHTIWMSEADVRAELGAMAAGGVRWAREDFRWDMLEPTKGTFDWRRSDSLMAGASAAGVDVLAILTYSSKWASSDPSGAGSIYFPPRGAADYAAYARAVVARYGPGGAFWATRPDLRPRPLTAVEMWNEPWGWWNWKSGVDPVRYASLAYAAGVAVKAENPGVKVLIAGDLLQVRTDGAIVPWIDNVLAAEPRLAAVTDAYSVHPYPYPRQQSPLVDHADRRWDYSRVELIRSATTARGAARPIWMTELGWSTADTADSVTEAQQATFLRDAVTRAAAEWPYVERIFVYTWTKDRPDRTDREANYGLRRPDGSYKPAWAALQEVIASETAPTTTTTTTIVADPAPVGGSAPLPTTTTTTTVGSTKPKKVRRLAGAGRVETAAMLSAETFPDGAPVAYVASATSFPDALAAGPLAATRKGPVLLSHRGALDAATAAELRRLGPDAVHVLGGPAALSDEVLAQIGATTPAKVARLGGADRYETATLLSRTAFSGSGLPVAYIATGSAFPDALAGGALAARGPGPVLLTKRGSLPAVVEAELRRLQPQSVVILGGPRAVSDEVVARLAVVTGTAPQRLAGDDRFSTSAAIGASSAAGGVAFVATGADFPDALASVPATKVADAPMLLVSRDHVPASVAALLAKLGPSEIVVLGGQSAVSDEVVAQLEGFVAG